MKINNLFNRSTKRKLLKGNLTNIDVDLVSLLFDDMKPANGRGAVVKSEGKSLISKGSSAKFKSEEVNGEGYLYVTVYEPDVKDSQGDSATGDEIKKACERFSQKGMLQKNDVNHNMIPTDDCFIAENYTLKSADKEHYPDTKIGGWVQVIKFTNLQSELWQKVKNNKFNGVSLFGYADDTDTQKSALEAIKSELTKTIESLKAQNDDKLNPAIDLLQTRLNDMDTQMQKADNSKQISEIMSAFGEISSSLKKAINSTIKGEEGQSDPVKNVTVGGVSLKIKSEKKELYKALASVDSGSKMNVLTDSLGSQFIDAVIDADNDVLKDISVVELSKDESVDKGLLNDIVLKNSKDGVTSAQSVSTADIDCPTEILCGDVSLSTDTVEFYKDKKGEDAFGAYIEEKTAGKIRKALEKLIFQGDRDSLTAALKGIDGLVTQFTDATKVENIDKSDLPYYRERLGSALAKFSNDALSEKANFVIYVSPKTELAMRAEYANRSTVAGDDFLLKNEMLTFQGIPIKPRNMADGYYIIGIAKFIILGYRSDVKIKVEHDGDTWTYHWFVRARFGVTYASDDFVKCFNEVA